MLALGRFIVIALPMAGLLFDRVGVVALGIVLRLALPAAVSVPGDTPDPKLIEPDIAIVLLPSALCVTVNPRRPTSFHSFCGIFQLNVKLISPEV